MSIKNEKYAGKSLFSSFGKLKFDDKGVVVEPKLDKEAIEALSKVAGFKAVKSTTTTKDKATESDSKTKEAEEPKKEEKKAESEEKPKTKKQKRTTKAEDK